MRVIAGSAKGRKLKSSLKYAIRPTSDKVKGALFDILGPQIQGVGFLDLFAGTGNIGIEALSRGAKHTTFVEKKYSFIELIRHNLQTCGFSDSASMVSLQEKEAEQKVETKAANTKTILEENDNQTIVRSPLVGTFYRTPSPGASFFVEVGDNVKKGQILCIIEAMKLMNEVEAETNGKIISIFIENAQPVEYAEPLFLIET